jgi:urea ABC transporter permease protein UrtB
LELDLIARQAATVLNTIAVLIIVSLGLAVIFGVMRIINLAHGEFLMLGAYAVLVSVRNGLPVWVGMLVAPVVVGLVGLVVERLLIRFLYGRLIATMLATWGLSLILVQAVVLTFGPATQGIATPLGSLRVGAYSISQYSLLLIGLAVTLLLATYLVFTRTRYGILARAAAQNARMAEALGVNTQLTNAATFALGAALAGAAGALLAPVVGVVPSIGQAFIARAFMTVIVGGPAVITGTVSAAGILGGADSVVSQVATAFLGQAALLLLAVALLRVMPQGISGSWSRRL